MVLFDCDRSEIRLDNGFVFRVDKTDIEKIVGVKQGIPFSDNVCNLPGLIAEVDSLGNLFPPPTKKKSTVSI